MDPVSPHLLTQLSEIAELRRTYAAAERSISGVGPKCIVISSTLAEEGKTLTSGGLATMVARRGDKRVLAVDLNWYRPALHSAFGLDRTFGIDKLKNGDAIGDWVQKTETDGLDVLTAPLQGEGIKESGMRLNVLAQRILENAREAYDVCIVDTASVFPTNKTMVDPVFFSNKTDGLVLVVRTRCTSRKSVKRALMTLKASDTNVLGVVLNHFGEKNGC